ncbi:hypothetical protein EIN_398220 [Entamoeba invadens IP1]|uniref:Peptidase S74 domain-containing protein n=1 Tax=Entamoeba invadens IP1 TaxID=370355 RepID=A0A0A1UA38_ENTIV|nr:hypothetical protein EIN_398220 [Entamoeba invadens IP1]ELP91892.1 hypothetical protein EIN_398220 [Entamoeba invadens IP1]|eukprot:XP_004258663.1 hypothetical protein EIN_398220 [Entamoeba invadens IP1]
MQEQNNEIDQEKVLLVDSDDIPRTQKLRKKNWKCVFPNCNEPLKTRFNCYAHVWDAHLRAYYTQQFPDLYPKTAFKKTANKTPMKSVCEKYMLQLVEKTQPKEKNSESSAPHLNTDTHEESSSKNVEENISAPSSPQDYPFAFLQSQLLGQTESGITHTESPNPIQGTTQNYQANETQIGQTLQLNQLNQMNQFNPLNPLGQMTEMETFQLQNIQNQTGEPDFIKIEQITEQLRRLHVFGEIFAENGYLVRSDARSKTDIKRIEDALKSVTGLVGRKFAYKTDATKMKYGFIAQEVEEVIPEIVQKDDGGQLSVDYLGVIPYIVEALKSIHENTISLEQTSKEEYFEMSKIVEDAVGQLQVLMQEHGKNILVEKQNEGKIVSFEVFGPPIVVLMLAIVFSIFSIVLPFFVPYLFFTLGVLVILTIVLWTVVIAQRKKLKDFLIFRVMKVTWKKSQFFVWFGIVVLIHISFIISTVLGFGGLILTAAFVMFYSGVGVCVYVLTMSKACKWRFGFTVVTFLIALVLVLITSIVVAAFQPFCTFKIREMDKPYYVKINPKEPITPMVFSSPPWNCFSPKVSTDVPLPGDLAVIMPSSNTPNSVSPTIRGIVSTDISTVVVTVKMTCSGFIPVTYGSITFKSCETKSDQNSCLSNKCGWCETNEKCGFCEDGGEFCNIDGTSGCS